MKEPRILHSWIDNIKMNLGETAVKKRSGLGWFRMRSTLDGSSGSTFLEFAVFVTK
jgi:hypothetical protein